MTTRAEQLSPPTSTALVPTSQELTPQERLSNKIHKFIIGGLISYGVSLVGLMGSNLIQKNPYNAIALGVTSAIITIGIGTYFYLQKPIQESTQEQTQIESPRVEEFPGREEQLRTESFETFQLYDPSQIDPIDYGVVGIPNEECNCWFNSLMQVLLNDPSWKQILLETAKNKSFLEKIIPNHWKDILIKFIQAHEKAAKLKQRPPVSSRALTNALAKTANIIFRTRGEFQDCHETLDKILGLFKLQNPCKETHTNHLFEKTRYTSTKSGGVESNNGIIDLPLPNDALSQIYKLQNLICDYFVQTTYNEDYVVIDGVRVELNPETTVYKKQLNSAPQTLFTSIHRFINTSNGPIFRDEEIDIPETMSLDADYFEDKTKANYSLQSFIVYKPGHYISYIQKNGVWFLCNDANVQAVSPEDAMKAAKKAYVLCYSKL